MRGPMSWPEMRRNSLASLSPFITSCMLFQILPTSGPIVNRDTLPKDSINFHCKNDCKRRTRQLGQLRRNRTPPF